MLGSIIRSTNWTSQITAGFAGSHPPCVFSSCHIFFFCLSRLRGWGSEEVKEIPQIETEDEQDGAPSQKRSCAVCLWNR